MDLFEKIKNCQTSRQLDELRINIIRASESGEYDFYALQKAFIKKKNSLKRNGHTSNTEGYSMREVTREQKAQGLIKAPQGI